MENYTKIILEQLEQNNFDEAIHLMKENAKYLQSSDLQQILAEINIEVDDDNLIMLIDDHNLISLLETVHKIDRKKQVTYDYIVMDLADNNQLKDKKLAGDIAKKYSKRISKETYQTVKEEMFYYHLMMDEFKEAKKLVRKVNSETLEENITICLAAIDYTPEFESFLKSIRGRVNNNIFGMVFDYFEGTHDYDAAERMTKKFKKYLK